MNWPKLIAIAGLALVAGAVWAQVEVEWERTYSAGTCFELVGSPNGGCFMVGESQAGGSTLIRVDSNGDGLWARELGAPEQIRYHSIIRLVLLRHIRLHYELDYIIFEA